MASSSAPSSSSSSSSLSSSSSSIYVNPVVPRPASVAMPALEGAPRSPLPLPPPPALRRQDRYSAEPYPATANMPPSVRKGLECGICHHGVLQPLVLQQGCFEQSICALCWWTSDYKCPKGHVHAPSDAQLMGGGAQIGRIVYGNRRHDVLHYRLEHLADHKARCTFHCVSSRDLTMSEYTILSIFHWNLSRHRHDKPALTNLLSRLRSRMGITAIYVSDVTLTEVNVAYDVHARVGERGRLMLSMGSEDAPHYTEAEMRNLMLAFVRPPLALDVVPNLDGSPSESSQSSQSSLSLSSSSNEVPETKYSNSLDLSEGDDEDWVPGTPPSASASPTYSPTSPAYDPSAPSPVYNPATPTYRPTAPPGAPKAQRHRHRRRHHY